MINQIPEEMKTYNQWVLFKLETLEDGRTTKIPYNPNNGYKASVTDSSNWSSFAYACQIFNRGGYSGIGFVLTENDPFVFIDLDNPFGLDQEGQPKYPNADEIIKRQIEMYEAFQTYIERSPSGQGLHIIGRGSVPTGRKRDAVEVYSSGRYMTMTGDVIKNLPIVDINEWANSLWAYLAPPKPAFASNMASIFESQPEINSDNEICETAFAASNGQKFLELYSGMWHNYYTSQSEADLALINILAFYTDNREQVKRIFFSSALGQRPKAHNHPTYVQAMVDRSFDRKLPLIDFSALKLQYENRAPIENIVTPEIDYKDTKYTFPQGLIGEIAEFIYAQSPSQSVEISLLGALGFFGGIVGRSYNIVGSGLNCYYALLAETGRGKEAIASGTSKLFNKMIGIVPNVSEFRGPGKISSSPALLKQLKKTPCFFSTFGEFDSLMAKFTGRRVENLDAELQGTILDLYGKSGQNQTYASSVYSSDEKNIREIKSPCLTFLGECTPSGYFRVINEKSMKSGLLPRMITIEVTSKKPYRNKQAHLIVPSDTLVRVLSDIACYCLQMSNNGTVVTIDIDSETEALIDAYSNICIDKENNGNQITKSMWSRATLKIIKLAALVAVGINYNNPIINKYCFEWARNIIDADCELLISKFENNEVGTDNEDSEQFKEFKKACFKYRDCKYADIAKSYKISEKMHSNKVIPFSYIQQKLSSLACFKSDKQNASAAVKRCLQTMIDTGILQEISKIQAVQFQTSAKCYIIVGDL